MSTTTAKRALRAAAKVAFGAAFVGALPGCGGQAETAGLNEPHGRTPSRASTAGAAGSAENPPLDTAGGSFDQSPDGSGTPLLAAAGAPPDSLLRCVSEVTLANYPEVSTPVSADEAACCAAYDDAQIAAAGDARAASAFGADASFVNCCKAIISGFGTSALKYAEVSGPVRNVCCSSGIVAPQNELWTQAFCSPWGPPVPPALSVELEEVA